jgi:hypothetical protein
VIPLGEAPEERKKVAQGVSRVGVNLSAGAHAEDWRLETAVNAAACLVMAARQLESALSLGAHWVAL